MSYDYIDEIRKLAGLSILEAAPSVNRLIPMFDGIIKLYPRTKTKIVQEINWARENLEREDRVIWYLRFFQVSLFVNETANDKMQGGNFDKISNNKINQIASKSGETVNQIEQTVVVFVDDLSSVKQEFIHFLSMPINSIQVYQFNWQSLDTIISVFKDLETEWKEDQNRTVPLDSVHEVIIDFGNGYAWYDLNTPSCSDEARAMGHCGNFPRSHTDDTILSLRRKVEIGGESILTPILTFIRREDGYLTEMKGRGNDKPAERYHEYIIALLRHPIIEGLIGGGYMPENNFSMADLNDDVAEELKQEKPGLRGPMEKINDLINKKDYKNAEWAIQEAMDQLDMSYHIFSVDNWESAYPNVVVKDWIDFEKAAEDNYDRPVTSLFESLDELSDAVISIEQFQMDILDPEIIVEILEQLPPNILTKIYSKLNGLGNDMYDMANKIIKDKNSNIFYHYLMDASDRAFYHEVGQKATIEARRDAIIKRLSSYAYLGYSGSPSELYIGPKDSNTTNGSIYGIWEMSIPMYELLSIMEAGFVNDEGSYSYNAWGYDEQGWVDWEYTNQQRGEQTLDDNNNVPDRLLADMKYDEYGIDNNVIKLIAYFFEQNISMRESRKNKRLRPVVEDTELNRMRELAGIQ